MVKVRLVQRFSTADKEEFLRLERAFMQQEQADPARPKGRRYVSMCGPQPQNTFIWECEFETAEAAMAAMQSVEADPAHEEMYNRQSRLMGDTWMEMYELFE